MTSRQFEQIIEELKNKYIQKALREKYYDDDDIKMEQTIEDLKKAAISVQKMQSKALPKGFSWLSQIMAQFGWHRKYEILIFDKSKFDNYWPTPKF
jgi:maltose-binding protein MalE